MARRSSKTTDTDTDASEQQAGSVQIAADSATRARVWELHLRGVPKAQIAREVDLHRNTVSRYIAEDYREVGADQKATRKRKLLSAVVRMRRVQEQAWTYCDADDERERSVLDAAIPGTRYQSQRSQYLRVILDAEKEISRLEGLYEALGDGEGSAVIFRIIRDDGGPTVSTASVGAISPVGEDDDDDGDGDE